MCWEFLKGFVCVVGEVLDTNAACLEHLNLPMGLVFRNTIIGENFLGFDIAPYRAFSLPLPNSLPATDDLSG